MFLAELQEAIESDTPYDTFERLTGFDPGSFKFKSPPELVTLRCGSSWCDLTRRYQVLMLLSLDVTVVPTVHHRRKIESLGKINHELQANEQRAVPAVSRRSKPRDRQFKIEDL